MAKATGSQPIDLQDLLARAAMLELKIVDSGIEYWQLYVGQAAKLSSIANSTIEAMQANKASLPEAAQRLTKFGKENADAFTSLAGRLSERYFTEVARLTQSLQAKPAARTPAPSGRATRTRKRTRPAAKARG
ncbi:MAG TPA: hypothetical protein VLS49_04840 [Usitatibacter sp.]|nr:hypothetical protein [Usitatibacter sp.]